MPTFAFNSLMCDKFATSSWSATLWIESTNRSQQPNISNKNINIQNFNLQNKIITSSTSKSGLSATFVDLVV